MFADLMNIISDRLKTTNLFSAVHPLVRRVTDGQKTFPSNHRGHGQGKPLEWDKASGMAYFRKRSQVSFSENTDEDLRMTSCDDSIIYNITIPLRLVIFINAGKADCNNIFSSDFFAEWIIGELSGDLDLIGSKARLVANGVETDSIAVLQSEYSNSNQIGDINYEYCYLYIDFNLLITANQNCLNSCISPVEEGDTSGPFTIAGYTIAITPNTHSDYATLIGAINGSNKVFKTPGVINDKSKVFVMYNGQFTGSFTVTDLANSEITLGFIPAIGSQLTVFF